MAKATRNAIYDALWALFKAAKPPASIGSAWITQEQRLRQWDDVVPADQPAMFHLCGPQTRNSGERGVGVLRMRSQIWFYWRNDSVADPAAPPRNTVMELLDWAEDVLAAPIAYPGASAGRQTLGNMVENCYIDGAIVFDEGIAPDLQGVCVVPITILLGR